MNRGKLAVISILLLGLVLAGFAWWWNYQHGRRCLDFWGDQGALRIRRAPKATLLWLGPPDDISDTQQLRIGAKHYSVLATQEAGQARGLIHARHALLDDASYEWEERADPSGTEYSLAVRFVGSGGATTAAFDFAHRRIAHVESGREQNAAEKIVAGWRAFADRQMPEELRKKLPRQ